MNYQKRYLAIFQTIPLKNKLSRVLGSQSDTLLVMKCSQSHSVPQGFSLVEFQLWTRKKKYCDVRHTWPALSAVVQCFQVLLFQNVFRVLMGQKKQYTINFATSSHAALAQDLPAPQYVGGRPANRSPVSLAGRHWLVNLFHQHGNSYTKWLVQTFSKSFYNSVEDSSRFAKTPCP